MGNLVKKKYTSNGDADALMRDIFERVEELEKRLEDLKHRILGSTSWEELK